jgi:hypothetical protein
MTSALMFQHLKFGLDKLDTQSYPDILEEQAEYVLNEAQLRLVKTRYSKNNIYQRGFEELQKRTEDLRTLVKNVELIPTLAFTGTFKAYKVNIQDVFANGDTYMFYLRGNVQVNSSKCSSRYTSVKLVQLDDLDKVLADPFNKPTINEPVITFEDGGIFIYADSSFNVSKFRLTYLKKPRLISIFDGIDCELPEHMHEEVVALAIELAALGIESPNLKNIQQSNQGIE